MFLDLGIIQQGKNTDLIVYMCLSSKDLYDSQLSAMDSNQPRRMYLISNLAADWSRKRKREKIVNHWLTLYAGASCRDSEVTEADGVR